MTREQVIDAAMAVVRERNELAAARVVLGARRIERDVVEIAIDRAQTREEACMTAVSAAEERLQALLSQQAEGL